MQIVRSFQYAIITIAKCVTKFKVQSSKFIALPNLGIAVYVEQNMRMRKLYVNAIIKNAMHG